MIVRAFTLDFFGIRMSYFPTIYIPFSFVYVSKLRKCNAYKRIINKKFLLDMDLPVRAPSKKLQMRSFSLLIRIKKKKRI